MLLPIMMKYHRNMIKLPLFVNITQYCHQWKTCKVFIKWNIQYLHILISYDLSYI